MDNNVYNSNYTEARKTAAQRILAALSDPEGLVISVDEVQFNNYSMKKKAYVQKNSLSKPATLPKVA